MIIGIDASKAAIEQKTGIDNVTYQVILNLQKIDKKNKYLLYTNKPLDPFTKLNENFHQKHIPFPKFWHKIRLPLALIHDKPDIFIELTNSIPAFSPKKNIVLIHDLAFKYFPKAYGKKELYIQEKAITTSIKRAYKLIFTLQANVEDFLKFYHFPESNIEVIPLATNILDFKNMGNKKPEIDGPYFMSIGRLEKRKNTTTIIKAFNLFKDKLKTNHKLVLIGKNGYGFEEIEKEIKDSKYKEDIYKLGFVTNDRIYELYSFAEALIYPSLYEGFGLPILEAFNCGTPVITSNIPTIQEVAKDAVVYVEPKSPKAISDAMQRLIAEPLIRRGLIEKGKKRAEDFSWHQTAEKYYNLIQKLNG